MECEILSYSDDNMGQKKLAKQVADVILQPADKRDYRVLTDYQVIGDDNHVIVFSNCWDIKGVQRILFSDIQKGFGVGDWMITNQRDETHRVCIIPICSG